VTKEKIKNPPKLVEWILSCIYPDRGHFTSVGDFREEYPEVYSESGPFKANIWYWKQIAKSIPSFIRNKSHWSIVMIHNYMKIALRNIKRHKGYSFINIAGLAIGMTCFIFIMLYVQHELSFDNFHEKKDRIYRVIRRNPGQIFMGSDYYVDTPEPLAKAMMDDLPEVEHASRAGKLFNPLLSYKDSRFYENGIIADENFLNIFSFTLLRGDKSGLSEPNTIYLTERLAKKYFGNEDPMNKIIDYRQFMENYQLIVKGIIEDVPHNSHIRFDFIISFETWKNDPEKQDDFNWGKSIFYTYLTLEEVADYKFVESKLAGLFAKYTGNMYSGIQWMIEPLGTIHLHSDYNWDWAAITDIKYLYIFGAIGMVILLVACINYMSLATGRSAKRAREIGIRKVVGARNNQLIRQFLSESVILSILSAIISAAAVKLLLPVFNNFTGLPLTFNPLSNSYILPGIFLLVMFTGIISGSYPALLLSSFRPVKVLKSGLFTSSKGANLRNFLVVFQFFTTVTLIVGTIVIYKQLLFIKNIDLGYKRDHVIVIESFDENIQRRYHVIKSELLKNPAITGVTRGHLPMFITMRGTIEVENVESEMVTSRMYAAPVGYDYLNLFDMEIVAGRDFSREIATDETEGVIMNEEAVKRMGWDDPIGKKVNFWARKNGRVIGVVKNFNFFTLHERIEPVLLYLGPDRAVWFAVRSQPEKMTETFNYVKETINRFTEKLPAGVSFMDDLFYAKYKTEQNLGEIMTVFAAIAIFIACLGLFGLASFTAERRTKEIGIRKVLGASVSEIFILLCREFTKWVLLANIIAWPVAYYFMNKWLQSFAFRINIGLGIFLTSGMIALAIALLTVSYQSIKAATANPVDSLRYE